MNKKEISWEEGEARLLENPKVAEESGRLEPEFQALRQLIILRKKIELLSKSFLKG